jgi:hypothetical protein
MEFAERLCVRQMGPGRDRYTIDKPIGGDLTQPGQCIAPFQSQAQELADRFPKRSHGQGRIRFHSIVSDAAASSIEDSTIFTASTQNKRPNQLCSPVVTVTLAFNVRSATTIGLVADPSRTLLRKLSVQTGFLWWQWVAPGSLAPWFSEERT